MEARGKVALINEAAAETVDVPKDMEEWMEVKGGKEGDEPTSVVFVMLDGAGLFVNALVDEVGIPDFDGWQSSRC